MIYLGFALIAHLFKSIVLKEVAEFCLFRIFFLLNFVEFCDTDIFSGLFSIASAVGCRLY